MDNSFRDPPSRISALLSLFGKIPIIRTFRKLSRQQWLYFPRLFSSIERVLLVLLTGIAITAFWIGMGKVYVSLTLTRPEVGGTLREGVLEQPRFMNPLYAANDTDRDLTNLVFAKLIRYDHAGEPSMDLAERVEISEDGKIYIITLRQGVEWHDGELFGADDVIFTIKAIQDPEYKSPLRQNWQGVVIEKLDDSTIRFTLRQPYAPFLENLAIGILPEHLWRKIPREGAALSDLNIKPVGTGPYRFEKLTRLESGKITSVTLVRNRYYHLEGPYLREILILFYPNEDALATAYRRNEIDGFLFQQRETLENLKELDAEIQELTFPKLFAVFLNASTNPTLGRPAVRRALALAIDRTPILERTSTGGALVNSAIPPAAFGYNPDIPSIPYDPERAKQILERDGWNMIEEENVRERTEGTGKQQKKTRLEIRLATSDTPELEEAVNMIAEMWRAIGVSVEISVLPVADLETSLIRPRAYEALLFGEVFGHDPDPFAFWHTSQLKNPGLNIALYSNRIVDTLLEEARRTSDPKIRSEKYREFQKIVSEEIGAIFLYSPRGYYALRKNIHGADTAWVTLPEERFGAVNTWYANTRRILKWLAR